MLLYDRVMEAARKSGLKGQNDRDTYAIMTACPVYELTDVVPLFDDWEKCKSLRIPKKPPHSALWCEWLQPEPVESNPVIWHMGALIVNKAGVDGCERIWLDAYDGFACVVFRSLVKHGLYFSGVDSEKECTGIRRVLLQDVRHSFFVFNSDYCEIEHVRRLPMHVSGCSNGDEILEKSRGQTLFGILPFYSNGGDHTRYHPTETPWPPMMAFALLNCKNVVTEEHAVSAKARRMARWRNRPPESSFKTLRVQVPASAQKRGGYSGDGDDGPKVRFHLVRGHFKNLQHDRYREKGWHWWPAHWRGDAELGTVKKTYQLVGSER